MIAARFVLLSAIILTGCRTAEKAAVTTFHVIDAPAHYIREHIDRSETTTTTTTVSDVSTPGAPIEPTPKVSHREASTHRTSTSETTRPQNEVASTTSRKTPANPTPVARQSSTGTTQFPTAKPVPGKPGYVYSIDPAGGIIDVTGYKPGDKAKDPYTKQIFIVP